MGFEIKHIFASNNTHRKNLSTSKMKLCLVSVLLIFFIIDSNGISVSPENGIPVERRFRLCFGGDDCCTYYNKCEAGQGDCDTDNDCKDGLKCGNDNCGVSWTKFIPSREGWDVYDDCCYKP